MGEADAAGDVPIEGLNAAAETPLVGVRAGSGPRAPEVAQSSAAPGEPGQEEPGQQRAQSADGEQGDVGGRPDRLV